MWVGDADELAQVRWVLTRAELDELLPGMYQARARLPRACSRVLRCCFEGRALAAPDPRRVPGKVSPPRRPTRRADRPPFLDTMRTAGEIGTSMQFRRGEW